MNVVLYARISHDPLGLHLGVDRQLDDLRELARGRGDYVIDEFVDDNESIFRRRTLPPRYRAMRDLVETGCVNAIYVWHPDRLYRSLRDLEDLVDMVDSFDLTICTVRAGTIDLTTPSGRMVARMLGTAARFEVEHKAERIARRNKADAALGLPGMGGVRPIGYEIDRVTINEREATAIRAAAQAILDGETLATANRVFDEQVCRPVHRITFKAVLTSHRIAGYRLYRPIADLRRGIKTGVVTKAVWPAIVDEDTWIKLRLILLDPRRSGAGGQQQHLLTGILRCGRCGGRMSGSPQRYICQGRPGTCGSVGVSRPGAERTLIAWCLAEPQLAHLRRLLRRQDRMPPLPADSDRDARRRHLAISYADGSITADEWEAARRQLDVRDGGAVARQREQREAAADARRALDTAGQWEQASVNAQRAAIRCLLDGRIAHVEPVTGVVAGRLFDPNRITVTAAKTTPRVYPDSNHVVRGPCPLKMTPENLLRAWAMLDQGYAKTEIAAHLGMSRGRVYTHLGRPRPTSPMPAVEPSAPTPAAALPTYVGVAPADQLPFPPPVLGVRAAARALNINQSTVVHLAKVGTLHRLPTVNNRLRFRAEDVHKLVENDRQLNGSDWMDAARAAETLGVHPRTLRRWAQTGRVRVSRTLKGGSRYRASEIGDLAKVSASMGRVLGRGGADTERASTRSGCFE